MNSTTAVGWVVALAGLLTAIPADATVSPQEAARLKNELTPMGAERAGNADGSIPDWTGGMTTAAPGSRPGGRRDDPFQGEQPLVTITAQNMDQYAGSLTDGTKALLKKYPGTYKVNVYKTHRTAAAPQWVYDNTFANATRATLQNDVPTGAYGGIPFPVPQSGAEVIWNHQLRWRGGSLAQTKSDWYALTADGRIVVLTDGMTYERFPYYFKNSSLQEFQKNDTPHYQITIRNSGPPIRAGEALLAHERPDQSKTETWVYLKGQRRVRRLPNACCDTPTPAAAGLMTFDEIYTFVHRIDRFDWKLLGKQEMIIPYNTNRLLQAASDREVLMPHHLKPEHLRWEKHRVWVVEATLREGQRHHAPKSRYYCDEDTWICVLADRWDAKGQLWRTLWTLPFVAPELPAVFAGTFGVNDLLSGIGVVAQLFTTGPQQYIVKEDSAAAAAMFTPDSLVSSSVR